jgi:hypothetical protein
MEAPRRFTFPRPRESNPLTARNSPAQQMAFKGDTEISDERKSRRAKKARTKGQRKAVNPKAWKKISAR